MPPLDSINQVGLREFLFEEDLALTSFEILVMVCNAVVNGSAPLMVFELAPFWKSTPGSGCIQLWGAEEMAAVGDSTRRCFVH